MEASAWMPVQEICFASNNEVTRPKSQYAEYVELSHLKLKAF
jgi:hypothetical protein